MAVWTALSAAKSVGLRRSCASAAFHLVALNPALAQHLVDKASAVPVAEFLQDSSARVRQAVLSLLLVLFTGEREQSRARGQSAVAESSKCFQLVVK